MMSQLDSNASSTLMALRQQIAQLARKQLALQKQVARLTHVDGESMAPGQAAKQLGATLQHQQPIHLANNVPLSARADLNPVLSRYSLLGRFLEKWERIFVLCYKESCAVHRPNGGADGRRMWWPAVQRRVVIFDGAELDEKNIDMLRWAGCALTNTTAGRASELTAAEPCRFNHRGGGADWRRTSKHRLATLLAHLTMVEQAAKLNLSRVLILEADAVPTQAGDHLSRNRTHALHVAHRMGRALATNMWSVLRLSGMFYSQEYAPSRNGERSCTRHCLCSRWKGNALVKPLKPDFHFCKVAPAPKRSDMIVPMLEDMNTWCDVRDTAAYAVHQSAFAVFVAYLNRLRGLPSWLRNGANDVPAIDNWLPHTFPCVYVFPTLVSQPTTETDSQGATGTLRQRSARNFEHYCLKHGKQALAGSLKPPRVRRMKLTHFATRHLYVLSDHVISTIDHRMEQSVS